MNEIFKKLQFKNHEKIYVLNAPQEFKTILEEMSEFTTVKKSPNCKQDYEFALFFIKSCDDILNYAAKASAKIPGDGLLWFAYPKKTSKNYKTDISRDNGWQPLGDLGFEGVRMIAIDEDWSALRFRRVEFIKSLKRSSSMAMSKKGLERIQK
jgi:hypothetical protein